MAYYGISSNLIVFLTKKLHQGTVTSANNVTNWAGTIWITPILGAYVADAHLGRYWTFVTASIIYFSVRLNHYNIESSLFTLDPDLSSSGGYPVSSWNFFKEISVPQMSFILLIK
jgi:hypothetical protein